MVAFCLFAVLLVLLRGYLLWTAGMQNPDEAELFAEGRTAALDLFPYSGYTTSTHLFLWPLVLGVLDLVGVPMTLITAHVLGGLAYVFVATTTWFLLMRRIGGLGAALLVLPVATTMLTGYDPDGYSDFLSMTSEALPLVVLSVAALVMLGPTEPMTTRRLVVGSMVTGLCFWTKPQSAPVGVALIAACVLMAYVEQHRARDEVPAGEVARHVLRSGSLAFLSFLTPTAVFLLAMAVGGTLDDFVREPVAAMWNYTAHRDKSQGTPTLSLAERLDDVRSFTWTYRFVALGALGTLLNAFLLLRLTSWWLRGLGLGAILLPVLAGPACLLPLTVLFPHYANFLYIGFLLSSCLAVRLVVPGAHPGVRARWAQVLAFVVAAGISWHLVHPVVAPRLDALGTHARGLLSGDGLTLDNHVPVEGTPLATECPAGSRVLAWGWVSELYGYYDWTPASRYVNASWIVYPSANQQEFAATMGRELRDDPPDCIVEALGPAFFAAISTHSTLGALVPGAADLLTSCYARSPSVVTFDGRALTLYRRTAECAAS
jgi:hypothetical protein